MPYGELIEEAFRIAIGHRYLWPFGLFASTSFSINVSVPVDNSGEGSPDEDSGGRSLELDPELALAIGLGVLALGLAFAALSGVAALMLVFLPLFVIAQHALRELVLAGRRPLESLRGGWRLLRARLGHSLLLVLIQQGIAVAAGLVGCSRWRWCQRRPSCWPSSAPVPSRRWS